MNFWELFKNQKIESKNNSLKEFLLEHLQDLDENEQIIVVAICGLVTKVAYADLTVDQEEFKKVETALCYWLGYEEKKSQQLCHLAVHYQQEFAGVEDHLYSDQLALKLNEAQKFQLLITLFHIASANGEIDQVESETIRGISKGLRLSNQHFLAARAKFKDYLKALQN
jgi:uncharacterized tellurite resistance protein B-like protein